MNRSVTLSAISLALAASIDVPSAAAQRPAPRPEPRVEERVERMERVERRKREARETRREAERRTVLRSQLAPRAGALARAFALGAAIDPDRAVLGVTIGDGSARGIRIEGVTEGSPAASAGIRAGEYLTSVGDVSLRLSGSDVDDPVMRGAVARRLTRALDSLDAGDEVTLRVAGESGAERTVRVRTVRADSLQPARATAMMPGVRIDRDRATLGLSLAPSGTSRDTLGAFVASVGPGGPAERAGVYEGMRVAAIGDADLRVAPADVEDRAVAASRAARLERAMGDVKAGDEVTLRVWDGRAYRDVRVRSEKSSDVYDRGRPFPIAPLLEPLPGGASWRMLTPAAPVAPGARVRVVTPGRRIW